MGIDRHVNEWLLEPLLRRELSISVDDFALERESEAIPLGARITLEKGDSRFRLELRDPEGRDLMDLFPWRNGMSVDEFFTGTGTIGNQLRVRLTGIQPPHQGTNSSIGAVASSMAVTHFARIELPPHGSELLTFDEFSEKFGNPAKREDAKPPGQEEATFLRRDWEHLRVALFADTKAHFRNASRTREEVHPFWGRTRSSKAVSFDGDLFGGRFSLLDKSGHLQVGFHFPAREGENPEEQANALFSAVGYVYGIDPWPIFVSGRDRGRLVDHHLRSTRPMQGKWIPLSKRIGDLNPEAPSELLTSVAHWLYGLDEETRKDVTTALWVFRGADNRNVPTPAKLSMLGAVIESLFSVCDEIPEPEAFGELRDDAISWARQEIASAGEDSPRGGFAKRLTAHLGNFSYVDRRVKWASVFQPLFPGREEWLNETFKIFQANRNPAAHGRFAAAMERNGVDLIHAIGRLSGFVNLVIAAKAGYMGPILESTSDDTVILLE